MDKIEFSTYEVLYKDGAVELVRIPKNNSGISVTDNGTVIFTYIKNKKAFMHLFGVRRISILKHDLDNLGEWCMTTWQWEEEQSKKDKEE